MSAIEKKQETEKGGERNSDAFLCFCASVLLCFCVAFFKGVNIYTSPSAM